MATLHNLPKKIVALKSTQISFLRALDFFGLSQLQKNNLKIQILKLLKDQKILKNQMIHYLEIIETK